MKILTLKILKDCAQHNIKVMELTRDSFVFPVPEAKESLDTAIKMNKQVIITIEDEIELEKYKK